MFFQPFGYASTNIFVDFGGAFFVCRLAFEIWVLGFRELWPLESSKFVRHVSLKSSYGFCSAACRARGWRAMAIPS